MNAATPPSHSLAVWDIVRVDYPYADANTIRQRPALVIAAPYVHDTFGIVWLLMITSARRATWPFDVPVSSLERTGLPSASVVRTAKIATLDTRLAVRIGELPALDRAGVKACLSQVLSLVLRE